MSFYLQLQQETTESRNNLLSIPYLQQGAAGALSVESYLAFLGQAYHHVKHTIPLLMACGSRLPERLEWLRTAIGKYIDEEMGHQEWIINDINESGGDGEAVRKEKPLPATEIMVAYAYDTILRCNPAGFFGMVLVLEGTSIALATSAAAAIQSSTGLPQAAFSYLTSHGDLDIGHVDFFHGLMDRLDSPDDQQAVIHCGRIFYQLYGDIFRSLS
ncbi:MAG: iron-containing redox enzyme family protein [Mariprofundales bacterium]|nr:iron-containing redox enzyme family protein [Mariprofundales bacterium]